MQVTGLNEQQRTYPSSHRGLPVIWPGVLVFAAWFWLYTHPSLIGAVTFAIAGSFPFSPLKKRCLQQPHGAVSCVVRCCRQGVGAAWHLGLRHGMLCLGCCWALMLMMFGLGVGSLVWMAVLTGVMVVERTYPGECTLGQCWEWCC